MSWFRPVPSLVFITLPCTGTAGWSQSATGSFGKGGKELIHAEQFFSLNSWYSVELEPWE